ncbi:MAG: translation initiation factor, partial [Bacteroidota bacterium]
LQQLLRTSELHRQTNTPSKYKHDGKGKTVRISLDTKGRNGKSVTIVSGLQHNPTTMEDIARILKQHCNTCPNSIGMKDGNIEIQRDQHARATEKLRETKFVVR